MWTQTPFLKKLSIRYLAIYTGDDCWGDSERPKFGSLLSYSLTNLMRESLKDGYGGVYVFLSSVLSVWFYVSKEPYDVDSIWPVVYGLSEILICDPVAWRISLPEAFFKSSKEKGSF